MWLIELRNVCMGMEWLYVYRFFYPSDHMADKELRLTDTVQHHEKV